MLRFEFRFTMDQCLALKERGGIEPLPNITCCLYQSGYLSHLNSKNNKGFYNNLFSSILLETFIINPIEPREFGLF